MAWELIEEQPEQTSGLKKFGSEAQRHIARTGTRVIEQGLGLPGDILDTLVGLGEYGRKKIGISSPEEEQDIAKIRKYIPTTEKLRKLHEPYTKEYLKPQNKIESFFDDVVQDATLLLTPGGQAKVAEKYLPKVFKKLAISTGANLAGESVEQFTGSKEAGSYAKIGSLFLLSLLDKKSAKKQISELYDKAESTIPPGTTINSGKLDKNLQNLEHTITKGRPKENLAASEKFVIDEINKFERLSKDGNIPIDQLMAQRKSLNEELTKLYQNIPAKKDQHRARNLAKQINHFTNEILEDYGRKNPEFINAYKAANQAHGTMQQSNWFGNWVENNFRHSPLTAGLLHLFSGPVGATIGSVVAPYQIAKLGYRVFNSPVLAKIYGKTLKATAKEDAVLFNKYLKELDEAIQKEESKDYWEFID